MVGPLGLCRRKRGGRLRGRGGGWGWGLERRGVATEGNTGIMNKIFGMRGKEVETIKQMILQRTHVSKFLNCVKFAYPKFKSNFFLGGYPYCRVV